MTTLDALPNTTANPSVIDGTATPRPRTSNPYRLGMWASSLILAGTGAAMFVNVDGTDLEKGGSAFALLLALTIWLTCLLRFNRRAEAGDR